MERSDILVISAMEDLKRHECYIVMKTDTWENKIFIYMKYQGAFLSQGMIESIDKKSIDEINMEIYKKLYVMFGRITSEADYAKESIHRA